MLFRSAAQPTVVAAAAAAVNASPKITELEKVTIPKALTDAKAYTDETKWLRPVITAGDLDDYTKEGTSGVSSTSVANLPMPAPGNLIVAPLSFSFITQTYLTYSVPQRVFTRYKNANGWSAWSNQSPSLPNATGAVDVNTLRDLGPRAVISTTAVNAPVSGIQFGLDTFPVGPFLGQIATTYEGTTRRFFRRQSNDTFTPWVELPTVKHIEAALVEAKKYTDEAIANLPGGGSSSDLSGVELVGGGAKTREYEDVVRRGKGGVIGTGGKAVISFRFDHGLDDFKLKVWPLFEARGIPGSFQVVSDSIGNLSSVYQPTAATWTDLKEIHRRGVDIWSHSRTHGDPSATSTTWEREIIEPRDEIVKNGMRCMGWSTPGSPATYGGSLDTPDKIDSVAGRMIRANYGLYEMYMLGSTYRVLPTNGCRGLRPSAQIDSLSSAEIIAIVDEAVAYGYGINFMMHPVVIDQPGRITTAALTEVLDYVNGLRASNKLMLLTTSGLAFADPNTARRFDLNPSGAYASVISHPVRKSGLDGHTFELVAKVRSVGGGSGKFTVTSTMEQPIKILEKTVPVSAGSGWKTIRIPFLAGAMHANVVDLGFSSSAGEVEWSEVHAYPV